MAADTCDTCGGYCPLIDVARDTRACIIAEIRRPFREQAEMVRACSDLCLLRAVAMGLKLEDMLR